MAVANPDDAGEVVNCDKLMEYVNEMRGGGSQLIKEKNFAEALVVYQQGLDAIAQCDGLPMLTSDVQRVCEAKSILHSNRAQVLMFQELHRRAVEDCSAAITVDPNNVKAWHRRATCYEKIGEMKLAMDDVSHLLEPSVLAAGADSLQKESLEAWLARLRGKHEALAETFEDRVDAAQDRGIIELREQFEEVIARNKLKGNDEIAAEMADLIDRHGGKMSAEMLAAVYSIDEDDADIMLRWMEKAALMQGELASAQEQILGKDPDLLSRPL